MSRPKLLDLYCCQRGAGAGYARAGFEVTGVDLRPQPLYPFAFVQGDALAFVREHGHEFDGIHASPPCQKYVTGGLVANREALPDLVEATREALEATGRPYIIENVEGAPLRRDVLLCGSMFERPAHARLRRHRVFELGGWTFARLLPPCDHRHKIVGIYGHPHGKAGAWPGMLPSTLEVWREAIGAPWMDAHGCAEAIPPDYTELLGRELMRVIEQSRHGES